MSSHNIVMDPIVPPLAAHLCETFFFGASLLLDTPRRITEDEDSRGVHGFVCLLDLFHVVSIRASRLQLQILTRMLGAKGYPVVQE